VEQVKIIKNLEEAESNICEGDLFFLVPYKWWTTWKSYVNYDMEMEAGAEPETTTVRTEAAGNLSPSAIDTTLLIEPSSNRLKLGLIERQDYQIVNDNVWKTLVGWYGVDGPPIARKLIAVGENKTKFELELYPIRLQVIKVDYLHQDADFIHEASKLLTVKEIRHALARKFSFAPHKIRLWLQTNDNKFTKLNKLEDTLEDTLMGNPTPRLLVELQGPIGIWREEKELEKYLTQPTDSSQNGNRFSSPKGNRNSSFTPSVSNQVVQRGLAGLENLGNTCFMNSALQCLSNTVPLTEYFLSDKYFGDINPTNPIGMQGKIAESYAVLMKKIWSGAQYVSPTDFKYILGKFAPQFSGYRQHDSQELLSFLLDGLHEDLNKVVKKQFVEAKDTTGVKDEVAASEAWERHLLRNKSIIVDLFHGQLKSTLVCPDCGHISITFDPFMYLSVPLPSTTDRFLEVTFIPALNINSTDYQSGCQYSPVTSSRKYNNPIKFGIRVPKRGKVADLKMAVSSLVNIPVDMLAVADICAHKISQVYDSQKYLSSITDTDTTFIYELFREPNGAPATSIFVTHRYQEPKRSNHLLSPKAVVFSYPLILTIPTQTTNIQLYQHIWHSVRNLAFVTDSVKFEQQCDNLPFVVKSVDANGQCNSCYAALCTGCVIPCDEKKSVKANAMVAIEWQSTAINLALRDASNVESHPSTEDKDKQRTSISIMDCFKLFLETETLTASDTWYCPKCKAHVQASKKFDIWKLPEVLVVHLKRFQYNKTWREKIDTAVQYDLQLDLSPFVLNQNEGSCLYDLYAISHHSGGLGSGHYIAYAKNQETESWFCFNDSHVTKLEQEHIPNIKGAYILFFRRRTKEK